MSDEKFVAYYRVSTKRQGQSGLGLEAQSKAVADYLADRELVAEYTEIESGKRSDRPQLAEALTVCRRQRATLVIAKLDRLARNVAFVANLMESSVEFRCCDMPEANRTMLQLWAVMAEWERDQISRRTKEALAAAKARGVRLGSPAPERGSAIGAASTKAKAEGHAANVLPIIDSIKATGISSLRDIAAALNARGVKAARGGEWYAATVGRIIERASV
jgi:DNA invertase Pin-like site-specific DNA recombinase